MGELAAGRARSHSERHLILPLTDSCYPRPTLKGHHVCHVAAESIRRRQPLLRGDGRVYASHRARVRQALHAVGHGRRQDPAAGRWEDQPLPRQPDLQHPVGAWQPRGLLPRQERVRRQRDRALR